MRLSPGKKFVFSWTGAAHGQLGKLRAQGGVGVEVGGPWDKPGA